MEYGRYRVLTDPGAFSDVNLRVRSLGFAGVVGFGLLENGFVLAKGVRVPFIDHSWDRVAIAKHVCTGAARPWKSSPKGSQNSNKNPAAVARER